MNNSFIDFDLLAFPTIENTQYEVKGQGLSKVLVVAYFPEESKDEDHIFLENILKAANLTPLADKIFLLHTQNENLNLPLASLLKKMNVQQVLIFGLNPAHLGIRAHLPTYQFIQLNNQHIMWGHPIDVIRKERAAKKNQKAAALWQALKGQFLSS